tara:strand:+ start:67 stop:456 length:390 start_codon:yes stop_codon:yes gene_type:complete
MKHHALAPKKRNKLGKRCLPEEIVRIIREFAKPIGTIPNWRWANSQGIHEIRSHLSLTRWRIKDGTTSPPTYHPDVQRWLFMTLKKEIELEERTLKRKLFGKGAWRAGTRRRIPKNNTTTKDKSVIISY